MNDETELSDEQLHLEADAGDAWLRTNEAQKEILREMDELAEKLHDLARERAERRRLLCWIALGLGFAFGFLFCRAVFGEDPWVAHVIDPNHIKMEFHPPGGGTGGQIAVSGGSGVKIRHATNH
jgi:hypothetical protein